MATVAPTDEKQALAGELAEARALIERRESEAALETLARARRIAKARRDARSLREIRELGRALRPQVPRASESWRHADDLVVDVGQDLGLLEWQSRPSRENRDWLGRLGAAIAWLVGLALIWACIWVVYFFKATDPTLLWGGNCGPESDGWLGGRVGHMQGGQYESALTAAVVGDVLWAMALAAVWGLQRRRGIVLLAFPVVYVIALVLLWYVVSPAVWGDPHCVV